LQEVHFQEPNAEEIEAYSKVTVVPVVLPYLRAVVTDLTAKASLPPLVLDPVRMSLPRRPLPA
jgi:preprotein translocase subunit SecB